MLGIGQVEGKCVDHAAEVESPSGICTSDGEWRVKRGGCTCKPGYEPSHRQAKCKREYRFASDLFVRFFFLFIFFTIFLFSLLPSEVWLEFFSMENCLWSLIHSWFILWSPTSQATFLKLSLDWRLVGKHIYVDFFLLVFDPICPLVAQRDLICLDITSLTKFSLTKFALTSTIIRPHYVPARVLFNSLNLLKKSFDEPC